MDRIIEIILGNAGSAAVLAVAVAITGRFIRRPAVAHFLWVLVLLRLLAPPVFELGLLPPIESSEVNTEVAIDATLLQTLEPYAPPVSNLPPIGSLLLIVWLGGTASLIALATHRTLRLRRILAHGRAPDAALLGRIERVAGRLGMARPPTVRVVYAEVPPMLWGPVISPVLVLPSELLEALEDDELDTLIAHEIAHLRRRDHWVRHLELISTLGFWWHPVLWWARRQLRRAEELCCDLLVAQGLPGHNRAYADCLLKTLRFLSAHRPHVAAGSAMASLHDLKGRLTMIMTPSMPSRLSRRARCLLLMAAAALLVISPTFSSRDATAHEVNTEPIDLRLEGARLGDVLRVFAEVAELNLVIDSSVDSEALDAGVDVDLVGVLWNQALDTILTEKNLAWSQEGDVVWVVPREKSLSSDTAAHFEPITLTLSKADVRDVLRTFSQLTETEITIDDDVQALVTAELRDVPWDRALDVILRSAGLSYTVTDGRIHVSNAARPTRGTPSSLEELTKPSLPSGVMRYVKGGKISEPKKIVATPPSYPEEARRENVQGVVLLQTVIDAEGRVTEVLPLRKHDERLEQAAIDAVRGWLFEPAMLDGEPVAVSYVLTVSFNLDFPQKK